MVCPGLGEVGSGFMGEATMDVDMLASQVVPYITAAVGAYGAAVLTRIEDTAADQTVRVGQRLLRRLLGSRAGRPGIEQAVTALATSGGDRDFQIALRAQIKLALRQDPELAAQLAALMPHTPTVSSSGARSAAVGGDNSGQISTGDGAANIQGATTHVTGDRAEVFIGSRIAKWKILFLPFGFIIKVTKNIGSAAVAHPVAAAVAGAVLVAGGVSGGLALAKPRSSAESLPRSFNGSWSGDVLQYNTDQDYPAILKFYSAPVGSPVGTSDYPTLGCSGKFRLTEVTPTKILVMEYITNNPRNTCVLTDIISLQLNADGTLTYRYLPNGSNSVVEGQGTLRHS